MCASNNLRGQTHRGTHWKLFAIGGARVLYHVVLLSEPIGSSYGCLNAEVKPSANTRHLLACNHEQDGDFVSVFSFLSARLKSMSTFVRA